MRHQQKNKEIAYEKKPKQDGSNVGGGGKKNNNKEDGIIREKNGSIMCCVPLIKCARSGHPLPETLAEGVKFSCTNPACLFTKHLVHPACFRSLETSLMKLLTSQGYKYCKDKGVLLSQDKLWEPRGLALIQKNLKCECGKGVMKRDDEAWAERESLLETAIAEEKEKKKHKPAKALPTLQLTVKKGAPPPPNFHRLNTHYASSHSPPRYEATVDEDKYAPPSPSPTPTTKMFNDLIPSTTPTAKMFGNLIPLNRAALTKSSIIDQSAIKKPNQHVPIGVDPLESLFSPSYEDVHHFEEEWPSLVKQQGGAKTSDNTVKQTPVEHPTKSKPMEYNVEMEMKNRNVESKTVIHTVASKTTEVLEKEIIVRRATPLSNPGLNHFNTTTPTPYFHQRFNSKTFKDAEVQTDETSFPPSFGRGQRQSRYLPTDYYYDSEAYSINPLLSRPWYSPRSPNESSRKSEVASSSGRGSPFCVTSSILQPNLPLKKVSTVVTFLFKSDETFAVEIDQNGKKEKLTNVFDNEWTPLFLSMAERNPEVGEMAQIHYLDFPKYVVYDILKVVGKSMYEIQTDPKWDFKIVENNGIKCFQVETLNGLRLIPEDTVLAAFLKPMKARAEINLNTEIKDICISSNFGLTDSQKNVFKNAALKLGLNVLDFYVNNFD